MKKNSSRLTYEPGKKIEVENPGPNAWKLANREQSWYWVLKLCKFLIVGGVILSGGWKVSDKILVILEALLK